MIRTDTLLDRWTHELIVIRAGSRHGLIAAAERLSSWISAVCPGDLKDVAFTVNRSADPGDLRLAVLASDAGDLVAKLTHTIRRLHDPACRKLQDRSGLFFFETALSHDGTLAFLFPGEGSQYPNMLLDLCLHFPEIRACFDVADAVFAANGRDPLPSQIVFPMPGAHESAADRISGLSDMDYAVATVFAAEQALLLLLRRLGLRPDAAVGHSSGEFAALSAAGALPMEEDGQLFATWRHLNGLHDLLLECVPGAMLLTVAGVDSDTVASIVAQGHSRIHIAMDNCPHQLVLSGSQMDMRSVRDILEGRGAICTVLPITRAYHTPSFQPACERLAEFYASLPVRPLETALYSCTTTRRVEPNPEAVRCAAVEQWSRPVRFRETIETMYANGVRIFVEVGPRSNLTGFVSDILRGRPHLAVPLDVQQRPGLLQLQLALGRLAAHGVAMNLDYLYARRAPRQLDFGEFRAESAKAAEVMLSFELPRLSLADSALPPSVRGTWSSPASQGRLPDDAEYLDAAVARWNPEEPRLCSDPAMMEREDASMSFGVRIANAPGDGVFPGSGGEIRKADRLLMDQYFQTMEQFLESQQAVMQAFMESIAPTVRPPDEDGRSVGPNVPDAVAPERSPRPLLFRMVIASLLPGQSVSATCTLDVREDLFLRHHTIGGPPSVLDAGVLALPVLPLAMALEIMAQATSVLVGDKRLVGARKVRIHQWVIMDKPTRTLRVTAQRSSSAPVLEFEVEIADTAETGSASPSPQPVLAEGVLIFAEGYPTSALADVGPLHGARPYALDPSVYYRRVMFHGPSFRSVLAIERSGENGVDAIVKTQGGHALFENATGAVPWTDPVLIDSAGQLVGFWVADRFDTNFVVFPLGFEELQLYGPWPLDPTIVHASARSRYSFDGRIYSDIQLVMENGRPLGRLVRWEDKRFDFPRRLVDFWLAPCEVALSDPWNAAVSRLPADVFVRARCLNGSPNVLLGDGSDIWAQALARVVLSEQERVAWQALRHSPQRRCEWLAGRLVAKEASRELLRERYGIEAGPADITITPDVHGQPVVGGRAIERAGGRISVSIAHVPEFIVAIAGELDGRRGIGIDVQPIGSANDAVERGALTGEEAQLLTEVPPEARSEWVLRMWCAKEAIGKALGRGMAGTPLNIATRALDIEREDICLALAGSLAQSFPEYSDEMLVARTGRDGELVFATCLV
jgi:malonyl CoA-acyl carrier protein transacylase/phosphopantetheinyl transferase (holo-ACP synthase)